MLLWDSGYAQQDSTLWKPEMSIGLRSYFMSTSYADDFKNDHAWGQMIRLSLMSKQIGRASCRERVSPYV